MLQYFFFYPKVFSAALVHKTDIYHKRFEISKNVQAKVYFTDILSKSSGNLHSFLPKIFE